MITRSCGFSALILTAALALAGCKSTPKSEPVPDKSGTSAAQPTAKGEDIPKPSGTELPGFSVGEWSKYRVLADEGQFEITYKIVGEEEGAHWLEIVRGTADAGTVMQLLIALKNRSDPSTLEIRAAKIRMPGGH